MAAKKAKKKTKRKKSVRRLAKKRTVRRARQRGVHGSNAKAKRKPRKKAVRSRSARKRNPASKGSVVAVRRGNGLMYFSLNALDSSRSKATVMGSGLAMSVARDMLKQPKVTAAGVFKDSEPAAAIRRSLFPKK